MAIDIDFVAFGVAAEIVMVFDDQDARFGSRRAIEMRRREAADPAADDDQVIGIVSRLDVLDGECTVAQGMGIFKRSGMAAAHAGALRRIVTGLVL